MGRLAIASCQVLLLFSLVGCAYGQPQKQEEKRATPISVGEVAPDFTLVDQDSNRVTLSEARGKSPVVLVFYRGYW